MRQDTRILLTRCSPWTRTPYSRARATGSSGKKLYPAHIFTHCAAGLAPIGVNMYVLKVGSSLSTYQVGNLLPLTYFSERTSVVPCRSCARKTLHPPLHSVSCEPKRVPIPRHWSDDACQGGEHPAGQVLGAAGGSRGFSGGVHPG